MFPSVYMLKSMISIGIVLTLLLGVLLIYVLVYAFLISSVTAQILPDFRNSFIVVFMALSIFMILSSLSGIYGMRSLTQDSSARRTSSSSSTRSPCSSTL